MKMVREYKFKCPKCGETKAVSRHENVVVEVLITGGTANVGGDFIDYGEEEIFYDPSDFVGFYCYECGFEIPAQTDDELVVWLKENAEEDRDANTVS
jgi:hypothetical protein